MADLVLSLFPGIGLLDMAFEEEGFCIVRGPDLLWGGDVKRFHPPAGKFDGVIGGPPCQAFSPLQRLVEWRRTQHPGKIPPHENLIPEFERCIAEARPRWFVMENVPQAPPPRVGDYTVTATLLDNRRDGGQVQHRERLFCFGSLHGLRLRVPWWKPPTPSKWEPTVTGGHDGPDRARLQGLSDEWIATMERSYLTTEGLKKVIGNGVPLPLGRLVARAVREAVATRESAG